MGGHVEIVAKIAQPSGMGGELPQHRQQGPGMQGRQPRLTGRRPRFVVQVRERGERIRLDADDPIGMSGQAPVVLIVLDAWNGASPVVIEAGVHGRGREQVRDVRERQGGTARAMDVDAEQCVMVNLGKQPFLVLELEVRA